MFSQSYDPLARASDIARSRKQLFARKMADFIIKIFGLNRPGFLRTELIQKIEPVSSIPTDHGDMRCVTGHGRLLWRAETFYTEEPETIQWLHTLNKNDILWDVGANVGLYSIYAAFMQNCRVLSFEPEAMNYALLIRNIALNNIQDRITATNIPLTNEPGIGRFRVNAITKGGAWNQFMLNEKENPHLNTGADKTFIIQLQMGMSVDSLVEQFGFEYPTHMKIDVDGNEPEIIAGAKNTLKNQNLKSILIEHEKDNPDYRPVFETLKRSGFKSVSVGSTGATLRRSHNREDWPWRNIIWKRDKSG